MKKIFTTIAICCCQLMVYAQPAKYEIGFTEKEITIVKDKEEDVLKEITFKVKNADDDAYKDYKPEVKTVFAEVSDKVRVRLPYMLTVNPRASL